MYPFKLVPRGEVEPTEQRLQIEHVCCACGAKLSANSIAVCAVISIPFCHGDLITSRRIAWCDECWSKIDPGDTQEKMITND